MFVFRYNGTACVVVALSHNVAGFHFGRTGRRLPMGPRPTWGRWHWCARPQRELIGDADGLNELQVLGHETVRAKMEELLDGHVKQSTGSATRVMRAIFLAEELSFDAGEITDKGSINQRAVVRNRDELAESLYNNHDRRVFLARKLREAA